ncbi:MAG: aldehyde ferredoxin oxidoreductase [Spirochaetes bacterium]|nr:MAG: aldehyde ferredoxin oxidoreductase [Spirochaetota bacterium]
MNGWTGRILHADLSARTFRVEEPPRAFYERYIGGKGMAGHYLGERATLSWDDPAMPLLFFNGPLTGTPSPSSGRMTVMARAPLTGAVGDSSVGGGLGTRLKRAGWDGLVVTGRAHALTGLVIADSATEFRDAENLRGAEVSRVGEGAGADTSTAIIGPAAENGVLFASIIVDGHYCAGRGGLGLVMASKNLKYVSVRGTGAVGIFDPDELARAREDIFRLASASPALKGELGIGAFGTGALYDLMHSRRMMPTENFRATRFDYAEDMNAFRYKTRYATRRTGCAGCHILCKQTGARGETVPEFETMSHFSALVGNTDLDAVVEANRICNETGMDTISAASTIACRREIMGENLTPHALTGLLRDIAYSRGEGRELGAGSYRYAVSKGRPGASMSVKRLEMPAYDPRGALGMALAYATSTRGACHLRAYPIAHEILRKPVATDRFTFSGKARIVKIAEDMNAAVDSLTACRFLFFAATLEEYARALAAVTGMRMSAQDLLRAGERFYYAERIMNAANGFTAHDDDLPDRFFTEEGSSGDGIRVLPLDRAAFLRARADYYLVRGLDERGLPTPEKCAELGIV